MGGNIQAIQLNTINSEEEFVEESLLKPLASTFNRNYIPLVCYSLNYPIFIWYSYLVEFS